MTKIIVEAIRHSGGPVVTIVPTIKDGDREIARMGRATTNELVLEANNVARVHARFIVENGTVFFEDMGSTNGSYVNGEHVLRPRAVTPSDVIYVGAWRLRALGLEP